MEHQADTFYELNSVFMIDRPELNTFLVQPPNKDRSQIIIFLGPAIHGGLNKERIFILAEV
ncbi:MAG: hypothetical protein NTU97_04505, partial [Candidatus Magasanikbacteria bacterium]|nr:hypothetical protein [Candidatus Magasanikbacteria bacterium]